MGGGPESCCVGRVYSLDGAVPSHGTLFHCKDAAYDFRLSCQWMS